MQALRLCVQPPSAPKPHTRPSPLRLLRAYWVDDQDLLDRRVLAQALRSVDLPEAELLDGCATPAIREALRDHTEDAITRGIFDAPSFLMGGELFWGNDRLDFVEAVLLGPA